MWAPYCYIFKYIAEVARVFSRVLFSFLLSFLKISVVAGNVNTKYCFVKTQNAFRSLVAWCKWARCTCECKYENMCIAFQTFHFFINSGKVLRGFSLHLHKLCIAKKVNKNAHYQGNRAVLNHKMYFLFFSATAYSIICRCSSLFNCWTVRGLQTVKIFIFLYTISVFIVFLTNEVFSLGEMIC